MPSYIFVQEIGQLEYAFLKMSEEDEVAIDTETTEADYLKRKLVGISMATPTEAWYIPVRHFPSLLYPHAVNMNKGSVLILLKSFVKKYTGKIWFHNAVFDLGIFQKEGIPLDVWKGKYGDTMLAVALLGHGWKKSLKKQVLLRFNYEMMELSELKRIHGAKDPCDVPANDMMPYACDDAFYTLKLAKDVIPSIYENDLQKVYWDMECRLIEPTLEMYKQGVAVDKSHFVFMGDALTKRIGEIEEEWYKLFPRILISSSEQISLFFYEQGHWSTKNIPRGKNGLCTTKKEAIEEQIHSAKTQLGLDGARLLLKYKEIATIRNTFTYKLADKVSQDGRLRPSFHIIGADTGRWASSNPNCQNIPSMPIDGIGHIRDAFINTEGYTLIGSDYSQIELRMMAHFSQDGTMLKTYRELCSCCGGGIWKKPEKYTPIYGDPNCKFCKGTGFSGDIHQTTANECDCTRHNAKPLNFGLIYGMSPGKLSREINVPYAEAEKYHTKYFERYDGVRIFHIASVSKTKQNGYVRTLTGRKRWIKEIYSKDRREYSHAKRQVWNTYCQSSAADLLKLAMRNLYEKWIDQGLWGESCRMVLTVHDELLCEVKNDLVEEQKKVIKETMESVAILRVPLLAEVKSGFTWPEVH